MSKLVTAFLNVVGQNSKVVITVPEIGEVGIRQSMSMADRSSYWKDVAEKENKGKVNAVLLQYTVCDPKTDELIFQALTIDQIMSLPTHVTDPMVEASFTAVGIKKEKIEDVARSQLKKDQEEEPEQVKNSDSDQT